MENFSGYSKKELTEMCKTRGIRGISTLSKPKLIEKLTLKSNAPRSNRSKTRKVKTVKESCGEDECERKRTDEQEYTLYKLMQGLEVDDTHIKKYFTCGSSEIRAVVLKLQTMYPTLKDTIKLKGGQANFDFYFTDESGITRRIELKTTTKKGLPLSTLQKKPWASYGQFFQAFLKETTVCDESKCVNIIRFAKPLIQKWYEDVIVGVLMDRYGIDKTSINFESYYYLMFKSIAEAKKQFNNDKLAKGARDLFKTFESLGICGKKDKVTNPSEKKFISDLWKEFANTWMRDNRISNEHMLDIINSSLSQKDIWICTTKANAYIFEGPICLNITFNKKTADNEVVTLVYNAELKKPSEAESYIVDIEFRLNWKNCSQGVHNLAFKLS